MANSSSQLSGITVVYLIAIGCQIFVLLFIFAKRQIMRFAWAAKKGFHAPIGHGAPKAYREQILQQIEAASKMVVEPTLLHPSMTPDTPNYYRMKTIDDVKQLDTELKNYYCGISRKPREHLYEFLLRLTATRDVLDDISDAEFKQVCRLYHIARFLQQPYGEAEYTEYATLFAKVIENIRKNKGTLSLIMDTPEVQTDGPPQSRAPLLARKQSHLIANKQLDFDTSRGNFNTGFDDDVDKKFATTGRVISSKGSDERIVLARGSSGVIGQPSAMTFIDQPNPTRWTRLTQWLPSLGRSRNRRTEKESLL